MQQIGIVIETHGDVARVEVLRTAMCEGCAKREKGGSCACGELLGAGRVMTAEACNDAQARIGDRVALESATTVVLGYAALVFLLPIAAALLFYGAASLFNASAAICWAAAGAGLVLSFAAAWIVDRRKRGTPQIHIVSVIRDQKEEA